MKSLIKDIKITSFGYFRSYGLLICLMAAHWMAPDPAETSTVLDEALTIQDLTIQVVDPLPDGFDWPGLVRAVMGARRGNQMTRDDLERAIEILNPLAEAQIRRTASGWEFILHPRKRIKSIAVKGYYPLFEQDVRNAMTIYPGAIFSPQVAVPEQHVLVIQRYEAEGYINPWVRINWEQDSEDGHYHLTVVIVKGPYYALGDVRLTGLQAFDGAIIKARMKTWRRAATQAGLGRFRTRQLEEDIENLVTFYRRHGYAEVSVIPRLKKDEDRKRIDITVDIDEGPLYEVVLSGNEFFSENVLGKDLVLDTLGNRNNIGIYRSMRNIRKRYLEAGFSDVRVRRHEPPAEDSPTKRLITIEIDEGQRHLVRSITLQGHQHIGRDAIRRQMLTTPVKGRQSGVYVAQVLQEDLTAIQSLYLQNGFQQARIEEQVSVDPASQQVDVSILIDEGPQTRIGNVSIVGELPVSAADLLSILQHTAGAAYQAHLVREDENRLAVRITTLGYPHVQVEGEVTLSEDGTLADITYRVDPGPLVRMGDLFFTGNFRTRLKLLEREAGLKEGAPFDLATVLAAQRNLRNLNIFESVQVRTIGLKEKADMVPLLVEVVEKKPYFFETGGGFQTDKGLFARTKIGDRNFRGTNQQISLGGEVSGIGYRWDTGLGAPNIFGTRIRADAGLFIEREEEFNQDFGIDSYGGNLNLSRRLSRTLVAALGWRYENREQFLREQDASADVDPDALEPRRILVTTPTLWYDSRDSLIRPREGWYSRFTVDVSNGLDNDLDDFLKYQFDLRHFYTPYSRLTLAAIARVGYLIGDGDEDRVPEDQLFFLGGTTDVRGFAENLLRFDADGDPVGSRLALSGNLEARYDIGGDFELTAFVDAGSLQLASDGEGTDAWRWTVGLGLSYITPIGPIGLFYGHKLDPLPGESSGQFHFSIGYTF